MKIFYNHVKVYTMLVADIIGLFRTKYIFLQASFVSASIAQLACFLAIIQLLTASALDINWFLIGAVIFTASMFVSYLAQSKLLAIAIEYELHWHCRLAFAHSRKKNTDGKKLSLKQQSRHMGTILRNINIIISRLLVAVPLTIGLIYLEPLLTLTTIGLVISSTIPLYLVNKASSRSFQRMRASGVSDQMEGRDIGYKDFISRETLYSYEEMLRAPMQARLIVEVVTVVTVAVILLFIFNESVSLSKAVMFLVGARFLLSSLSATAGAFTALNRFYGTLHNLINNYFPDAELMRISSRNFDLKSGLPKCK